VKFNYPTRSNCIRYENRKSGHYKFYEIDLIPGPEDSHGRETAAIRAKWGVIGTHNPHAEIKHKGTMEDCIKVMGTMIRKRLSRGYEKVP